MDLPERADQVSAHLGEVAADGRVRATDQHIIPTGPSRSRQDGAGDFPQAAAGAVADDRIADLLGTGETDADQRRVALLVLPLAGLQEKARGALAARLGRAQEIGAFGEYVQTNGNRRWRRRDRAVMALHGCLRRCHAV